MHKYTGFSLQVQIWYSIKTCSLVWSPKNSRILWITLIIFHPPWHWLPHMLKWAVITTLMITYVMNHETDRFIFAIYIYNCGVVHPLYIGQITRALATSQVSHMFCWCRSPGPVTTSFTSISVWRSPLIIPKYQIFGWVISPSPQKCENKNTVVVVRPSFELFPHLQVVIWFFLIICSIVSTLFG